MNKEKSTILLVDDTPANLKILVKFLDVEGYDLKIALNGFKAIEIAKETPPDLILLDVMMDGMNGFETCKKIKSDQKLKDIPIIFLTALNSVDKQVEAFESGGVDFISKPLRNEEVLVRIKNHLTIRYQQKKLEEKNNQLKELVVGKEKLMSIIAHDLRSPITSLFSFTSLISLKLKDSNPELSGMGVKLEEHLKRTLNLIDSLLNWGNSKKDNFELNLQELEIFYDIEKTLNVLNLQAGQKNINLINNVEKNLIALYDKNMIQTVFRNLISNSIKFSNKGGRVWIEGEDRKDGFIEIRVKDEGVGIEENNIPKIFNVDENFHTKGTNKEKGSGFGLIFCKEMIERMGGEIRVNSKFGEGTTFFIKIKNKI
ncbi:MAG: hybrid sensor histidine kinase/response regulator [Leptospiraceae bacterium]|nr:hybrid sensor histidine kinase/response regulator [Leptospiraceae bacterium]